MKKRPADRQSRQGECVRADSVPAVKELLPEESTSTDSGRERVNVSLGALGPRLRAVAALERTSMSALVRRAAVQMLRDRPVAVDQVADPQQADRSRWTRIHLHLPQSHAAALAARARAAAMSRSELVWSLLGDMPPQPVPVDLAAAVRGLLASTDRVAVLSTDLSEFLRLLEKVGPSAPELQPLRESTRALHKDVREHLKYASVLLAALKPYRRPRP